jgi:hypothetical protein
LIVVGFIQAINTNNPELAQKATTQQKKSSLRDPIVWATVGIFVATAVNVGVGIAQWNILSRTDKATRDLANAALNQANAAGKQVTVMQGQLDAMREQTITTRAQIRANMARLPIVTRPHMENGKLVGWDVNPQWQNSGTTDARGYQNWFNIDFVEGPGKWGASDCPKPLDPYPPAPPIVIQGGRSLTELAQRMTIDDVSKVQAHQGAIFIVGHAQYRDIFPDDPLRQYDWCVFVDPSDPANNLFSFVSFREDSN